MIVNKPLDASLSGLTIDSLTLTPTFSSGVTAYTAETSAETNTIAAVATEEEATITIKVGETEIEGGLATWGEGPNTVTITVTNGLDSEVYTVIVTKS